MSLEGRQFAQYHIIRLLKRGGMGEVYLAHDVYLDRQVAIKVIRVDPSYDSDPDAAKEATRLFLREMRVIAQLDHRHILPVYGSGEEVVEGMTFMYMVMPLRSRGSLTNWLQKRGKAGLLSAKDVEYIVRQAASALQYAHMRQIVHQDVKPSNFLLHGNADHPGELNLQLADFGVAKLLTTTSDSQDVRGTPIYMAPEQWDGHAVPATDQYALAVMAYELLTGYLPFDGKNRDQLWYQHNHMRPQAPSTINPEIPKELDVILLRALAKDPEDRFRSISAFAAAFRQAVINSGSIHRTLTITPLEAQTGTQRFIPLPDGRQVRVSVSANAFDGQVIRIGGLGEQAVYGGPVGALIVTIAIAQHQDETSLTGSTFLRTVPEANRDREVVDQPQRFSRGKAILLIVLAVLLLTGSGGFLYFIESRPGSVPSVSNSIKSQDNLSATATAMQAKIAASGTATTAQTATAQAATTQTATAATATSSAVTATAIASATAVAVTATASAVAGTATAAAYQALIEVGTPALIDALRDNNQGHQWDDQLFPDGTGCTFTGQSYHDFVPGKDSISPCFARATDFKNFSYQIQLRIVKGNRGGIIFRANHNDGTFYCFYIDGIGGYGLEIYKNATLSDTLSAGPDSSVHTGPNQSNLIAVAANGDVLDLYINMKHIATVKDSTYDHGEIGVFAQSTINPTEVIFSDAQVWSR